MAPGRAGCGGGSECVEGLADEDIGRVSTKKTWGAAEKRQRSCLRVAEKKDSAAVYVWGEVGGVGPWGTAPAGPPRGVFEAPGEGGLGVSPEGGFRGPGVGRAGPVGTPAPLPPLYTSLAEGVREGGLPVCW